MSIILLRTLLIMRTLLLLLTTSVVLLPSQGVAHDGFVPLYYWVHFTDKNNTPYSLEQPEGFLSPRAIQRRTSQGISLNEYDLPVNPSYIDSLTSNAGVSFHYASRWFNGALIQCPDTASIHRIMGLPFVSEVIYVKPEPAKHKAVVNDKKLMADISVASHENKTYTYSDVFTSQVNAAYLHDAGYLGERMLIAVLDAGFTATDNMMAFDMLRTGGRIAGTRDFVNPHDNIFDTHPHGTYVLSVMAAYVPGLLQGTAPKASYFLIRTEDAASEFVIEEYNWLAGVELADSLGADIINSSLGYTTFDDPAQDYTYDDMDGRTAVVTRAANMAAERGMLVVNSAGNLARQSWQYISAPADSETVFSIGAVDPDGNRTAFSSTGPTADGRLKPDVMAMGSQVIVAGAEDRYWQVAGTSFSSPIIAGMAACLWQKHPQATAAEIKRAIMLSGNKARTPNNDYGHGIPDFRKASQFIESSPGSKDSHVQPAVEIFSNPVSETSVLRFSSPTFTTVHVRVMNTLGQCLLSFDIHAIPGINEIRLDEIVREVIPGVYYFSLSGVGVGRAVIVNKKAE